MKRYLRNTILSLLGLILVIVLIGVAAYVPYKLQQNTIDSLNTQMDSLRSQINTYRNRATSTPIPNQTGPSNSNQTPAPWYLYKSSKGVSIYVYAPRANNLASSPIAVVGQLPGNWSSEAQFPIKLLDSTGKTISQTTGHVLGNWMTSNLVPFSGQLTFSGNPSGQATLLIQKDNPSGNLNNDDYVSVPLNL